MPRSFQTPIKERESLLLRGILSKPIQYGTAWAEPVYIQAASILDGMFSCMFVWFSDLLHISYTYYTIAGSYLYLFVI